MFAGHYSTSFAAKRFAPSVPLWHLFIAAQVLDLAWGAFILLGVEHARVVPEFTAASPLDLHHMPYSHSLVAAFAWSIGAFAAYRVVWPRAGVRGAAAIGVVVLSHWLLDFIAHTPDLALYGDAHKMGLGLWNHAVASLAAEAAMLAAGIALYVAAPSRRDRWRRAAIVGAVLIGVQAVGQFGAAPPSIEVVVGSGLASYAALAGAAYWIERRRA